MMLVLPQASGIHKGVWRYLTELVKADNPILTNCACLTCAKAWPTAVVQPVYVCAWS